MGLGVGQVGISGQSSVHLTLSGTTRDGLLADAFVAVFEHDFPDGRTDTLRVIVPSEPAAREMVSQFLTTLGKSFGEGSHRDTALSQNAALLARSFKTDVSYVSDRLSAVLRLAPEKRPRISVIGAPITEHALLGGAVQFSGENTWYQLFPLGLIEQVAQLVSDSSAEQVVDPLLPSSH